MIPPPPPPRAPGRVSAPAKPARFTDGVTPPWVQVFQEAGLPGDVITLDFETYFDDVYTLSAMSQVEFVADPRWEVLGLAWLRVSDVRPYVDFDREAQFIVGEEAVEKHLRYLPGAIRS